MKLENLSDLRLLVETVRGGTLTAAGRALGVTPAAASASLKRLENRLGERLFERSTRALRITSQGQTLLDYATRAMELLDEAEAQLAAERHSLIGTVRVAASSDLTRSVLLPWFDEFQTAHPRVRLALTVSDRPQDVMRDSVDLALRYGELRDSRLVARTLLATRRVLCASPGYLRRHKPPRTPHDLIDHNCLTFHLGHQRYVRWRFEKAGRWTEVRVDGDREADDAAIAHQWATAGAGLLYKSKLDVMHDLESGRLVQLLRGWHGESTPVTAILPSNRFVAARVRALLDFLVAKFGSVRGAAS